MVERVDPARTGVKAGRVVGLLTAAIAVASVVSGQTAFYDRLGAVVGLPGSALFWGNAVLTATARYAASYVVGSLVGVGYDWLDRPGLPALAGIVVIVGAVDGALATLDTRNVAVGAAYVFAWLCYVPVFDRLFEDENTTGGPRRIGER